jgi:hypothetical protein
VNVKLEMLYRDYSAALAEHSNKPLLLDIVLHPFGMSHWGSDSSNLLIGHLMDALAEQYQDFNKIDPLTITEMAADLGHREAFVFLDRVPMLMLQMSKGLFSPNMW